MSESRDARRPSWTFLSNYAHVLVCLAQNPDARLREIAHVVGITERAAQRIVTELEDNGVIVRIKEGRRNQYQIHRHAPLRHPQESHRTVGDLLCMILSPEDPR